MRVRGVPKEKLSGISGEDWVDRTRRPYVVGDTAWVPVIFGKPFDRELFAQPAYTGRGFYLIECGETRHRESGYTYILDPSKVMFSQGNRSEKSRIAQQIRKGGRPERVADMFAGIGYFTIPMAGAGAVVHVMEINPVACGYLQRNVALNHLLNRITVSQGDCRDLLDGIYDRIVMGHFDAIDMLPSALLHVRPGSILHLHAIEIPIDRVQATVEGAGFSCGIQVHKVKKYRPHAWHVVHDITIL